MPCLQRLLHLSLNVPGERSPPPGSQRGHSEDACSRSLRLLISWRPQSTRSPNTIKYDLALLRFNCNSGRANVPQCYVMVSLPVFFLSAFICLITERHATSDIHPFACHNSALAINKLRSSLGGILCFLSFCMSDECSVPLSRKVTN